MRDEGKAHCSNQTKTKSCVDEKQNLKKLMTLYNHYKKYESESEIRGYTPKIKIIRKIIFIMYNVLSLHKRQPLLVKSVMEL